ncbi:MAG: hypothetical protein GY830_07670 [Bacteroidetes bacterium]|nr:hypothetical protein [Bacteroidota bacterium]
MSLKEYKCGKCHKTLMEIELVDGKVIKKCRYCKTYNSIEVKLHNNTLDALENKIKSLEATINKQKSSSSW